MKERLHQRRTPPADDVARAISLFFAVRHVIRTRLAQGKKLDPSTWLCVETMKFISDRDQPKMKELAEYLAITAPSATSLVHGLVRSGKVAIVTDARDRRASRLALTTKGKRELVASLARGRTLLGGLFAGVSEAELATFIRVLERMKTKAPR